eukprot:2722823-Rhodomonas_salina.4
MEDARRAASRKSRASGLVGARNGEQLSAATTSRVTEPCLYCDRSKALRLTAQESRPFYNGKLTALRPTRMGKCALPFI